MVDRKRSRGAPSVPHHPLPAALASDSSRAPKKATRLFGYPGLAANAKSTRLWLDTDLTSYVDVPDDAILHSQTLENDEGTILWVDLAATLTHVTPRAQEVQAEFLGGAIAEGNLAGAPVNAEWRIPGRTALPWNRAPQLTIALECPFTTVCRSPLLSCEAEVEIL
jgi:hypothetical protein